MIAQSVADEVERQHQEHDCHRREEDQVRGVAAGKNTRYGDSNRCERASFNMAPQLGAGGGTPSPRKLRVASESTAPAMPIDA